MANAILNENSSRTTENLPTISTVIPRIYVACLASHNNGILHGSWIDATQDVKSMEAEIQNMLSISPTAGAEEWEIRKHENFYGIDFQKCFCHLPGPSWHEYDDLERVSKTASILFEYGELGAKVIEQYNFDLKWTWKRLEEEYLGCYDNLADYARQHLDNLELEIPEYLMWYIDFEQWGRDLEMGGNISTLEIDHKTHVFLNLC